jgi:hypothetical protein
MSPYELDEVRRAVHSELAEIEQICSCPGSYTYCNCTPQGLVYLAHKPYGQVLRRFAKTYPEQSHSQSSE